MHACPHITRCGHYWSERCWLVQLHVYTCMICRHITQQIHVYTGMRYEFISCSNVTDLYIATKFIKIVVFLVAIKHFLDLFVKVLNIMQVMSLPSSPVFQVYRMQPQLVTPARPTPREIKMLSDIDDQQGLRFQIPVIIAYKNNPSMSNRKDPVPVIIREAISRALV